MSAYTIPEKATGVFFKAASDGSKSSVWAGAANELNLNADMVHLKDVTFIDSNGAAAVLSATVAASVAAIGTNNTMINAESQRAEGKEGELAATIETEATTARAAEEANAGDIATEYTRALAAEMANTGAIEAEVTRAKAEEGFNTSEAKQNADDIALNMNEIVTQKVRIDDLVALTLQTRLNALEQAVSELMNEHPPE